MHVQATAVLRTVCVCVCANALSLPTASEGHAVTLVPFKTGVNVFFKICSGFMHHCYAGDTWLKLLALIDGHELPAQSENLSKCVTQTCFIQPTNTPKPRFLSSQLLHCIIHV